MKGAVRSTRIAVRRLWDKRMQDTKIRSLDFRPSLWVDQTENKAVMRVGFEVQGWSRNL